jgi:hypothetical protein
MKNQPDKCNVQLFQPDEVHAAENSNPTVPEGPTSTRTLRSSTLAHDSRSMQQTLFDTGFFAKRGSDNMELCLQAHIYSGDLKRRR